jgi:glyoxylase-like metal-dependent hydrolase (beta-lactamase superfamily II)
MVLLTHHHPDECAGLLEQTRWPFEVHAPAGEDAFMSPPGVSAYWEQRWTAGVPASYHVLPRGIEGMQYDLAGFTDLFWETRRVRFLHTPGHGPNAVSIIIDHNDKQVAFCGDAVHDGATIYQPYNLEWDHWTGDGALAAWRGIRRLEEIAVDLLCPSHGRVIENPRLTLESLEHKLMALYHAKGAIAFGQPDRHVEPTRILDCDARQVLPHLYQFAGNGYLLLSPRGEAMVIDMQPPDLPELQKLLAQVGDPPVTVAMATHYHSDHASGLNLARDHFDAKVVLHPLVAQPLADPSQWNIPWQMGESVEPDELLPADGAWSWSGLTFDIAHLPGQTWWHAGWLVELDGERIAFTGDTFQTPSRWHGTGGFCSYNGCRFADGFAATARRVMQWQPTIIANGHGIFYRYAAEHYEAILQWVERAESAVRALCPSGDLATDYYMTTNRADVLPS